MLGNGLFTSEGDFWHSQRHIIQPAFHRDQIKSFAQVFHDFSMEMVNRWKLQKEIGLSAEMTRVTLQIISKTMLDIDIDKEGKTVEKTSPLR